MTFQKNNRVIINELAKAVTPKSSKLYTWLIILVHLAATLRYLAPITICAFAGVCGIRIVSDLTAETRRRSGPLRILCVT